MEIDVSSEFRSANFDRIVASSHLSARAIGDRRSGGEENAVSMAGIGGFARARKSESVTREPCGMPVFRL
ncbi:MAG: hypothetical protein SWY16_03495 [Cyanobacteriota bacterium]|nr:hypothetical protein [Cyanobacteriota bacterium]